MKRFFPVFISASVFLLSLAVFTPGANIPIESILNNVFDASSNTLQIELTQEEITGALSVGDDITLENSETLGNSTDGWVDVAGKFEIVETSAYTFVPVGIANFELQSSGTPANGLAVQQNFSVETTDDNVEIIATIQGLVADVTAASEDGELVFSTMTAGATATEKMRIHDTGEVEFKFGILPDAVTADPCGSGYPEGAIFYNTTSNYMCYCNGTNDVKMADDTTACF